MAGIATTKGVGGAGEGFNVAKSGDARIGLGGFPSAGKSTLLNMLIGTLSEVASYEFTTLACIPGVIMDKGAKVQLLDLPEDAGRSRSEEASSIASNNDEEELMRVVSVRRAA